MTHKFRKENSLKTINYFWYSTEPNVPTREINSTMAEFKFRTFSAI